MLIIHLGLPRTGSTSIQKLMTEYFPDSTISSSYEKNIFFKGKISFKPVTSIVYNFLYAVVNYDDEKFDKYCNQSLELMRKEINNEISEKTSQCLYLKKLFLLHGE